MRRTQLAETREKLLRAECAPDEVVLWVNGPDPMRLVRSQSGCFLFSLLWVAFALYWTWSAIDLRHTEVFRIDHLAFAFPGMVFVVIGIVGLTSPIGEYQRATNTVYGITDKRIMIIQKTKAVTHARILYAHEIGDIAVVARSRGRGDLKFATQAASTGDDDPSKAFEFLGIENPVEVEALIRSRLLKDQSSHTVSDG